MATKKPHPSTTPIFLRGLAGRTADTYALKALIRNTGAVLTRKGRSSNWMLFAETAQMQQIVDEVEQSGQKTWQWLAKLIRETCQLYSYNELLKLVKRNPSITVNQLMGMTDCTLADARKAIDEGFEW